MPSSNDDPNTLYRVPKSTTQPSVNQSHLTIHLNHPAKHAFRPGELIVGVVTLLSFAPVQTPVIITLTLAGKSKVTVHPLSTKRTSTQKQKLFQLSQVLSQNEVSSSTPTTVSLPFTFNFPSHFLDTSGKHEVLPPDMNCNALSPENPSEGSISYKLKANLLSINNTLSTSTKLYFVTPRTVRVEDVGTIGKGITRTVNYRHSPDTHKARPVRTRDSLPWNKTKNNEEQKLTFDFRLWHPAKVVSGEHFKITVEVSSVNIEDVKGKGVLPDFRFAKDLEIEIKSNIRLKDCAEAPNVAQEAVLAVTQKFLDSSHTGQLMTLDKSITFKDVVLKGQSVGPSFKSRHLDRSTEMIIRASIEVMGKVESFYVKCPNIEVLPNTYGPKDAHLVEDVKRVSISAVADTDDLDNLPRYEDVNNRATQQQEKTVDAQDVIIAA